MTGNPYEQPGWRGVLRPGGAELTRRLLELADLASGSAVLDVGCGEGDTCALLEELGFRAAGLDCSGRLLARGRARHPHLTLLEGDAAHPPVPPLSQDALLFECTLSAMDAPAALDGCLPLLRPGGMVLMADLYARLPSPVLPTRAEWEALLTARGLRPLGFEDQSKALGSLLAQKIMDGEDLCALLCRPLDQFRAARAGYCLLWAVCEEELP